MITTHKRYIAVDGGAEKEYLEINCLSTDTKPTDGMITGSKLVEIDTGKRFLFDEVSEDWYEQPASGGVEVESLPVTVNGTYTAPEGKAYSPVTVNVPNTYAAGDEGKVVSGGALVSQSSDTVTENGTVDTTLISSLTVNVSGGGGEEDGIIARTISGAYENSRVTQLGECAFAYCFSLNAVSFPNVTSIGFSAFMYCTHLSTASFPEATSIGNSAFAYCSSLTTASFPKVSSIGSSAFAYCNRLTTANFSVATQISNAAFTSCSNLTTASFPAATMISSNAFTKCVSLTAVSFPEATTIGNYAFANCSSLTTASFPKATSIGSYAFSACYRLISLYLLGTSIVTLGASNALSSTPIGGYSASAGQFGSIFVPSSLFASYIAATNWSLFSSRFVSV